MKKEKTKMDEIGDDGKKKKEKVDDDRYMKIGKGGVVGDKKMGNTDDDGKRKMGNGDDDGGYMNVGQGGDGGSKRSEKRGDTGKRGVQKAESCRVADDSKKGTKKEAKEGLKMKDSQKKKTAEKGKVDEDVDATVGESAADKRNVYVAMPAAGTFSVKAQPGQRAESFSRTLPTSGRPQPPLPPPAYSGPASQSGRRPSLSDDKSEYAEILD